MDNSRIKSAVRRGLNEIGLARYEQLAHRALIAAKSSHSFDFFRIVDVVLANDKKAKLILVLDTNSQSASFWYCYQCLNNSCPLPSEDLTFLENLEPRLKHIRDKTLFHIDRDAVKDSSEVWATANITVDEYDKACLTLWDWFNQAYVQVFGKAFVPPRYDGTDIGPILKMAEENKLLQDH